VGIIKAIYLLVRAFLLPRLILAAENLALRQQVAVYQPTVKRPKLRKRDRIFWVWLSRLWSNWRSALAMFDTMKGCTGTSHECAEAS
jgi:hypothetical protein